MSAADEEGLKAVAVVMKINFGSINGHPVMSFRDRADGNVVSARYRSWGTEPEMLGLLKEMGAMIPGHESFRRWKIARKGWRSRRNRRQFLLPL